MTDPGAFPTIDVVTALEDPNLFGLVPKFHDLSSWQRWIVLLRALFALPMSPEDVAIYAQHTGRTAPPSQPVQKVFIASGRRSGKTFMSALIAVYLATFRDYRPYLTAGERAKILCLATDRDQAGLLLGYIRGILEAVPLFAALVEGARDATLAPIDLANRVTIKVSTCSYRAVRGQTIAGAILDELAFWRVEGANPDREVLRAIEPGTGTIPHAPIIGISSRYARSGLLYEALRDHHGKDDARILTWSAGTEDMNPTFPAWKIAEARVDDPSGAASEYGETWRQDLESFLSVLVLAELRRGQPSERAPQPGLRYVAAVDPSGGGADAFTVSVAHAEPATRTEAPRVQVDLVRGWTQADVENTVQQIKSTLTPYGITAVVGDYYAGEWPSAAFRRAGIQYIRATLPKSQIYMEFLPLANTKRVALLDHDVLINEFERLERKPGREGKDTVDHPSGAHDDYANAAALAAVLADRAKPPRSVEDFRHMLAS